jgi:hypothetical protein
MKGVSGTLPDTLASIRYCDEVMARSLMMMFTSLDQHGSEGARVVVHRLLQAHAGDRRRLVRRRHHRPRRRGLGRLERRRAGAGTPARLRPRRRGGPGGRRPDPRDRRGPRDRQRGGRDAFRERYELPPQGTARKLVPVTAPAPPDAAVVPVKAAAGRRQRRRHGRAVPAAGVAEELALDGGDPPEELHVTLAFLGSEQDLADPRRCTPPSRRGRPTHRRSPAPSPGRPVHRRARAGHVPVGRRARAAAGPPGPRRSAHRRRPGAVDAARLHAAHDLAVRRPPQRRHAGGEPLDFGSVSLVVGQARTDYPLGHGDT